MHLCPPAILALTALLPALWACNAGTISMERLPYEEDDAGFPMATEDAGLPEALTARELFDTEIAPILGTRCAACHESGDVAFMAGGDVYGAVVGWPALVIRHDPSSSRIVTKRVHAGPEWTAIEDTTVRAWLELEEEENAGEEEAILETPKQPLSLGLNTFPLDAMGITGGRITFTAETNAVGMLLSRIRITAGEVGAHLVHPVVMVWDGDTPTPDASDRFSGDDLSLLAYDEQLLGTGNFTLIDFPTDGRLSFHFTAAGPLDGAGGGGGTGGTGTGTLAGGCTSVAGFTAAVTPILRSSCTSCHGGGNPSAQAAVDMADVLLDATMAQQLGCNEILTRIDLMDPPNSALIRAPAPASTHPFSFSVGGATEFAGAVLDWVATEGGGA
ncbi:MAG: hypothetical protein JRH11_10930 [Deltaproteobacteria bacterium]|nr:hypothetical protein [Deltaproteobacteria bacterium]